MEWLRFENHRASLINLVINRNKLRDKEYWDETQEILLDKTLKIIGVFKPLLQNYIGR